MKQVGETLSEMMVKIWERSKSAYSFEDLEGMAENLEEPYCFWAKQELDQRINNWAMAKQAIATKDLWIITKSGQYPYCNWAMEEIVERQKNKQ